MRRTPYVGVLTNKVFQSATGRSGPLNHVAASPKYSIDLVRFTSVAEGPTFPPPTMKAPKVWLELDNAMNPQNGESRGCNMGLKLKLLLPYKPNDVCEVGANKEKNIYYSHRFHGDLQAKRSKA